MIKEKGFIAANYGGEDNIPWVSATDIAAAVADEITAPLVGRKIRYVASDELTCKEAAGILGDAMRIPGLKWITITDEQMQNNLESVGMPSHIAAGLVELNASMHNGVLLEDYYLNKPRVMGEVKMKDFAKEFAGAFKQKTAAL